MAYFCNVGSIVRKSDLKIGRMRSADIFLFVDNEFAERYQSRKSTADDSEESAEGIESIAEGVFACVYFRGFEKELGFAERLLNHIAANRMRINGDYLCEVVAELPLFPTASRDMLVKLEIPVMF